MSRKFAKFLSNSRWQLIDINKNGQIELLRVVLNLNTCITVTSLERKIFFNSFFFSKYNHKNFNILLVSNFSDITLCARNISRFEANISLLYSLLISEKLRFSGDFKGYKSEKSARNVVKSLMH